MVVDILTSKDHLCLACDVLKQSRPAWTPVKVASHLLLSLEEAPLLRRLTRVELARILPEIEVFSLSAGMGFDPHSEREPSLYLIRSGELELVSRQQELSLGTLGPGHLFGEEAVVNSPSDYTVRATAEALLARIPAARMRGLARQHPELNTDLLELALRRLGSSQQELVRTRAGLRAYSAELWGLLDDDIAAAGAVPLPRAESEVSVKEPSVDPWVLLKGRKGLGFLAALIAATTFLYLTGSGTGLHAPMIAGAAVLVWAVINWMFDTMPDYVVALGAIGLLVAGGISAPVVALSGFANPTWFLSLAILGIGSAIARSGLLFRTALHMLRLLPATYWGQSLALGLAGVLLTPVLPSPSGRVAVASPLALEIAEAMRLGERSSGSAGLSMSVLLGFGQMYFLFLNGTGSCILLWSLLPAAIREEVTWGFWLLAALPLGVAVFVASFLTIQWLLRPERTLGVSRQVIEAQLVTLGPVSRLERVTLLVVSLVLLAFLTQPLHGIDPAWTAVAGLLYLIATGIMERTSFRHGIDWAFLMLYGGLIGLAAILEQTGITDLLTAYLNTLFQPLMGQPVLFLTLIALTTALLRVAVPMVAAALLMAVALYPLAEPAGISPFLITLSVQVASNPWVLPHQNTFYQTAVAGTEGRGFTHRQVLPVAVLYVLFTVMSIPLAAPVWRLLGLLPQP